MVRSTILVRASDSLPLAASVDDEQVRVPAVRRDVQLTPRRSPPDRAGSPGTQTAVETDMSANNTQLGAALLN